jgi:hypothetical protein
LFHLASLHACRISRIPWQPNLIRVYHDGKAQERSTGARGPARSFSEERLPSPWLTSEAL